jgi:YggT family protein
MSAIFRFVSALLSVYMMLLFVRILLTWFSGPSREGKAIELLQRATDPYLAMFRRFAFLRTGRIDFSPIAAIIVLVVLLNVTNTLALYGSITVGIVLALVTGAVGSALFFLVGFFLLLAVVRTISVFIGASSIHPFWQTVDVIINPVVAFIHRTVLRGRQITYRNGLALASGVLLAVFLVGRLLVSFLVGLFSSIPF